MNCEIGLLGTRVFRYRTEEHPVKGKKLCRTVPGFLRGKPNPTLLLQESAKLFDVFQSEDSSRT